jgi:hypothetical protein
VTRQQPRHAPPHCVHHAGASPSHHPLASVNVGRAGSLEAGQTVSWLLLLSSLPHKGGTGSFILKSGPMEMSTLSRTWPFCRTERNPGSERGGCMTESGGEM